MIYRILSALLSYPNAELLAAQGEIVCALKECPEAANVLDPLMGYLSDHTLIALQENYVATFDGNPGHSLHLFEHIHGESRERGQAMVDLLQEYQQYGFEPEGAELPDYLPLLLEFLSVLPPNRASALLGEAIHVIAAIGARLTRIESPYAAIFSVLTRLTQVVPREMTAPPVRDMDEAMAIFGPGSDGVEPLLQPDRQSIIHLYPNHAARKEMGSKK